MKLTQLIILGDSKYFNLKIKYSFFNFLYVWRDTPFSYDDKDELIMELVE